MVPPEVGAMLLPLVGDDQDTVDYIVATLEDATSTEEYTEIIEAYVEEADDPARTLSDMLALLGVDGEDEGAGGAVLLQGGAKVIGSAEAYVAPPTTLQPPTATYEHLPTPAAPAAAPAAAAANSGGGKGKGKGRGKGKDKAKEKPPVIDVSSQ